ncbi:MAG: hypothetical protein ACI8YQ_002710 [Polaribacter sp.]
MKTHKNRVLPVKLVLLLDIKGGSVHKYSFPALIFNYKIRDRSPPLRTLREQNTLNVATQQHLHLSQGEGYCKLKPDRGKREYRAIYKEEQ